MELQAHAPITHGIALEAIYGFGEPCFSVGRVCKRRAVHAHARASGTTLVQLALNEGKHSTFEATAAVAVTWPRVARVPAA
eukprot:CAMPEP_0204585720 /NCGR_PEP_ID=MMETSP0661-20131031/47080_1 /ASSEMBLY_ACC=CAM_ASM_000606 /TAXON_ID=109239 /ORGANISM="Alexandrium margalefi, Strain AMGDE01CS-322" /LENGTH=80 /DNA_ID=CAMNT_0051595291 /DNA_START=45 /DNA_END=285 /DNA_ORIENTATION=-